MQTPSRFPTHGYDDVPLPKSLYGEAMFRQGAALVMEHGAQLDKILWDADEVLWDWVMDLKHIARQPARVLRRDMGHREYFMLKPGMFELLWGMHLASLHTGQDPYMRIWTNGYPWRIWQICEQAPGIAPLLGPPTEATHHGITHNPRIFSRLDYVQAASLLVLDTRNTQPAPAAHSAQEIIRHHLSTRPHDSSLKLPELARHLPHKEGVWHAQILVDDQPANIARFVRSGRLGVQVVSREPILFHRMVNMTWGQPLAHLQARASALASQIAHTLGLLTSRQAHTPHLQAHAATLPKLPHAPLTFSLDIPDAILRSEWIDPIKPLKALSKRLDQVPFPPGPPFPTSGKGGKD